MLATMAAPRKTRTKAPTPSPTRADGFNEKTTIVTVRQVWGDLGIAMTTMLAELFWALRCKDAVLTPEMLVGCARRLFLAINTLATIAFDLERRSGLRPAGAPPRDGHEGA